LVRQLILWVLEVTMEVLEPAMKALGLLMVFVGRLGHLGRRLAALEKLE
jgi:hypothetical protein